MQAYKEALEQALGIGVEAKDLTFANIALRGVIVFVVTLVAVRMGDKRFMSKTTAFDVVLGLVLASMLARAINGTAPFWPTLGCGFIIVGLHRAIAFISRHWHPFGQLAKGNSDLLIKDGQLRDETMRCNDMSQRDLEEGLRLKGVQHVEDVRLAFVERNGEISVIRNS